MPFRVTRFPRPSNSILSLPLKIALLPFGSAGDVLPFVWLARHLQAHGHETLLITASLFKKHAAAAGIPFIPIGEDSEFETLMRDPRIWKLGSGTKAILEYAARSAEVFYHTLATHSAAHGAPDIILGPVTAFGARLTREKMGIPLITVHLQPAVLFSAHDTPIILPSLHRLLRILPVSLKSFLFRHGPNPLDLFAGPILRRLSNQLQVSPPKSFFRQWWDSPDGSLILFPEWFASPQPDWPPNHLQTAFPLEDLAAENPLSDDLTAFLNRHQKTPPVVFTAGSANVQAAAFFASAATALTKINRPGVFVTRDLTQLPPNLPDSIHTAEYVAFGPLLRHSGAFVHHGGIGTLSQGFAAGVPQLIMPMAHDQPDNAARLLRLNAGSFLTPRQFTPDRVASALSHLLQDPHVIANARGMATQVSAALSTASIPTIIQWLQLRATSGKANPA